jgi:hypothetical protein
MMDYCSNRNYGPRIYVYNHRGLDHVKLENKFLSITVLADKGADILSFIYKPNDTDILLRMPGGIRETGKFIPTSNSETGAFFDYYPGGWQEGLPGGNPKTIAGAQTGLHGEACCLPWDYKIIKDDEESISVEFKCELIRFPYLVIKTLTLKKGEKKLYVDDKLKNYGDDVADLMWSQHVAFGSPFITPDCTIDLDAKDFRTTTYFDSPTAYFPTDSAGSWPVSKSKDGDMIDLTKVSPKGDPHSDMYFIKGIKQGEYTIHNPGLNMGVKMMWDKDVYPYVTYINVTDGAKGYPFYGRVYFIGLELWNSFSDVYDEAKANGSLQQMAPGEEIETQICVEIV